MTGICHQGKIILRAWLTVTCCHEKFVWSPGWWEWLAKSAKSSWRVIRLIGYLIRGSCVTCTGKWLWNVPSVSYDQKSTSTKQTKKEKKRKLKRNRKERKRKKKIIIAIALNNRLLTETLMSVSKENSLLPSSYSKSIDNYRYWNMAKKQKSLWRKRHNNTARGKQEVLTPHKCSCRLGL